LRFIGKIPLFELFDDEELRALLKGVRGVSHVSARLELASALSGCPESGRVAVLPFAPREARAEWRANLVRARMM
jgi:hypothetical protein